MLLNTCFLRGKYYSINLDLNVRIFFTVLGTCYGHMEVIYHRQKENTLVINVSHRSLISYSFLCLRSHFKLV